MKRLTKKNLLVTDGGIVKLELAQVGQDDHAPVSQWAFCAPLTQELLAKQRADLEEKLQAVATLTESEIPGEITEALGRMEESLLGDEDIAHAKMGFGPPIEICWN